jgi:hypothetical protein
VSDANPFATRTIVKWICLYAPHRWPPGIMTRPEVDQHIGGTKPADFAADVEQVVAQLQRVTTQPGDWQPHPIFGRMSTAAWMRWGYLHTDHHLRQFGV